MEIKLLPHQYEFLTSDSKFLALIAGIGAGKTFTLAHYIINRAVKYPNSLHFIGANTYSQLRTSTMSAVFQVLTDLNVKFVYNSTHGLLEFGKSKILCKSIENFNMLRGIEIATFILDEARDIKTSEPFDMLMGRLRDKYCNNLQGRIVTSPAGFNWIFDYFDPNGEKNNQEFKMIRTSSMSNKYLPSGYLESIKDQYSESFYKQEIMGEFINLTSGKVYYSFNRDKNVKDVKKVNGSVIIGLDFNVSPYCGVICQFIDGKIYVFDEIYIEDNGDTYQASALLASRGYKGCEIIPDSTGRNRKTSGKSDFEILKEAGHKIHNTHNPYVIDRVNNINRLLAQDKIVISPNCKKLINDLEKVVWKGNDLDQTGANKWLTHISDSLGYVAWRLLPIQGERAKIALDKYM